MSEPGYLTDQAKTYFCPRGCNVFTTRETAPECGSCGSIMGDDPEPFDGVIEAIEKRGIAEVESRQKPITAALQATIPRPPSTMVGPASAKVAP